MATKKTKKKKNTRKQARKTQEECTDQPGSPVRVGIWVPPSLQGNALELERRFDFKECVIREIDKYIDLQLGVKKFGTDWVEPRAFDAESDAELYLKTRAFLDASSLDGYQVGIHPKPLSAWCVPPEPPCPEPDPDKPCWEKFRAYQIFWRTEKDGLINWTTDAAAKQFERERGRRIGGTRLRDEVCSIPICAYVKTGIRLS